MAFREPDDVRVDDAVAGIERVVEPERVIEREVVGDAVDVCVARAVFVTESVGVRVCVLVFVLGAIAMQSLWPTTSWMACARA